MQRGAEEQRVKERTAQIVKYFREQQQQQQRRRRRPPAPPSSTPLQSEAVGLGDGTSSGAPELEKRVSELETQLAGAKDYHMRRMREMKERHAGQLRATRLKGGRPHPRDQWDAGKEQELKKAQDEVCCFVCPPCARAMWFALTALVVLSC